MRILKARLMERAEEERKANIKELKGDMGMGTWGNQIRSYVFKPYHGQRTTGRNLGLACS